MTMNPTMGYNPTTMGSHRLDTTAQGVPVIENQGGQGMAEWIRIPIQPGMRIN